MVDLFGGSLEQQPTPPNMPKVEAQPFTYQYAGRDYPIVNLGKVDWTLPTNVIQYIRRETLKPDPDNGRTSVQSGELEKLVASIKKIGIHTELKVRRGENDDAILIGGHKRLAAAMLAKLDYLPCKIYPDSMTNFDIHCFRVLDNEHRTDIPPVDRAREYRRLLDIAKQDGQTLSVDSLATHLEISSPTIYQYLKLLTLPAEVQTHVNTLRLTMAFAQQLFSVKESTPQATSERQIELSRMFIAGKLKSLGTADKPSTRPDTSGRINKKYVHQRSLVVDEDTTVVIGSRNLLTDEQLASVLSRAQAKLVVPIHGHKAE